MENKVLVVDDDPNICELVRIALSTKGYRVNIVQSGSEWDKRSHDIFT